MKKVKLIQKEFPKEVAEFALKRIQPFLEEYTEDLRFQNSIPWPGQKRTPFDLKDLMFSCYLQGLRDFTQVHESALIKMYADGNHDIKLKTNM